jgi:hypothetical protein
MLIFGGVHAAAQGVGHPPQLGLIADVGGYAFICFRCFGHSAGLFFHARALQAVHA